MKPVKLQMSAAWVFVRCVQEARKQSDGLRLQRMLMRRVTQALLAQVGDERPAVFECAAELAIAGVFPLHLFQLRFTIGDWAMVSVVGSAALRQSLRIEAFTLREEDGLDTYGLLGLHDNNPVIAITAAPTIEKVIVRIGGFDRSIVVHDGALNPNRHAR